MKSIYSMEDARKLAEYNGLVNKVVRQGLIIETMMHRLEYCAKVFETNVMSFNESDLNKFLEETKSKLEK